MIGIGLCTLSTLVGAQSANVFKWVDNNGVINYGDRPSEDKPTTVINKALLGAGDSVKPLGGESGGGDKKDKKKEAEAENNEKTIEQAKKECDKARQAVRTLTMGGRISVVNEKGEKDFLSDLQVKEKLIETQKIESQWCDLAEKKK